jgi:class 3 adenylate cyclase
VLVCGLLRAPAHYPATGNPQQILAAAVTVRQAGTKLAEPVGPKQLKGRQEPVDIYRIRWLDVPTAPPPGATAYAE